MNTAATANAPENAGHNEPDYVGQIENFSDPSIPDAPPAPLEPEAVNKIGEDDERPAAPQFYGDDKRAAFYARLREQAAAKPVEQAETYDMAPFASKDGQAPVENEGAQTVEEAMRAPAQAALGEPPAAPQAPAPKTYELKVNRNTFTATRDQLLQMAGLSNEEAEGVPETVLVRSAQIAEAARQRLVEAKSAPSSETADRQFQQPHPADGNGQDADGRQPSAQESLSALSDAELARLTQYGDEEDAAAAQREFVRRELRAEQQQRSVSQVRMTVDQALSDFEKTNSDLVQNVEAMELLTAAAVADVRAAMIQAGANPDSVANLSQKEAIATYSLAVANGHALPPVGEILGRAEQKARRLFNMPRPGNAPQQRQITPTQQPQPSAYDRRMAAKSVLPQTPTRAGSPTQSNPTPVTAESNRKSTLDWMRQARGQTPLHR
jgi:hypothetical protein